METVIRILSDEEIEAGGGAMPTLLADARAYFVGKTIHHIQAEPFSESEPYLGETDVIVFNEQADDNGTPCIAAAQVDDEGNRGAALFCLPVDHLYYEPYALRNRTLPAEVIDVGYVECTSRADWQKVAPYLRVKGKNGVEMLVLCYGDNGGAVLWWPHGDFGRCLCSFTLAA